MVASVLCACHADVANVPAYLPDPYGSLRLETRSIVMSLAAPYDTLRLRATPYSVTGAPMTAFGTPTYKVSDTSITVNAKGLVTAKTQTSNSYVVVSLRDTAQNVTRVDTAFITVTNETAPPTLASFSLHPAPGDSAKFAINDNRVATTKPLFITATGTHGEDLSNTIHVRFRSSDTSIATVNPNLGFVKGFQMGNAVITATTTWYGVTKSSSLTLQIGNPVYFLFTPSLIPSATNQRVYDYHYAPTDFTIGVGAIIEFQQIVMRQTQGMKLDFIFDDPTAAQPVPYPDSILGIPTGSGNVHLQNPTLAPGDTNEFNLVLACYPSLMTGPPYLNTCNTTRYFPKPGRFTWHSDLWGAHGTITVTKP